MSRLSSAYHEASDASLRESPCVQLLWRLVSVHGRMRHRHVTRMLAAAFVVVAFATVSVAVRLSARRVRSDEVRRYTGFSPPVEDAARGSSVRNMCILPEHCGYTAYAQ